MRDTMKKLALGLATLTVLMIGSLSLAAPAKAQRPWAWRVSCVGPKKWSFVVPTQRDMQGLIQHCVASGGHPSVTPLFKAHVGK